VHKLKPEIKISQPLEVTWDEEFEVDVLIKNKTDNMLNNVKATLVDVCKEIECIIPSETRIITFNCGPISKAKKLEDRKALRLALGPVYIEYDELMHPRKIKKSTHSIYAKA